MSARFGIAPQVRLLCVAWMSALCVFSFAPTSASAPLEMADFSAEERRVVLTSLQGARLKLHLEAGETLEVFLLESFELGVRVLRHGAKEGEDIAWDRLLGVERLSLGELRDARPALDGVQVLTHHDGTRQLGLVMAMTGHEIELALANGSRVRIARDSVRSVAPYHRRDNGLPGPHRASVALEDTATEREISSSRIHRTRYLFMKSAKPLAKGEGHVSQKEVVFSEFSYGLTDNLSLIVVGVLPTWFVPGGFNLGVGLSAGFELADDLYISAALQTAAVPGVLVFDEDIVGGLNVMTTLTWGPDKAHLSLGAMVPMVFDADFVEVHPTFIFGALIELTDWLALITEHWVSPTMLIERSDFGGSVHMGGVRFQFGGFSFDVAAMHILRVLPEELPLLPWVDLTYHWGTQHEVRLGDD